MEKECLFYYVLLHNITVSKIICNRLYKFCYYTKTKEFYTMQAFLQSLWANEYLGFSPWCQNFYAFLLINLAFPVK